MRIGDILIELEKQERLSEVEEAERNYQADQLRVERAKRDFERERELKEKGYTDEKAYLDAKTDLEIAEIELAVRLRQGWRKLARLWRRRPFERRMMAW